MNKFFHDKKIKLIFFFFKEPDLELNPGSNYVYNQNWNQYLIVFEKNTKTEG
jgi:hypothetical protein